MTINKSELELAVKITKMIDGQCKEVPHDIGIKVLDLIKEFMFEEPKLNHIQKKIDEVWSRYKYGTRESLRNEVMEVLQDIPDQGGEKCD